MSRSFIYLRRALFGTSCAIVFGFGMTQAFASPTQATFSQCKPEMQEYCATWCPPPGGDCQIWNGAPACFCY